MIRYRAGLHATAVSLVALLHIVASSAYAQDVPPVEFMTNSPLFVEGGMPEVIVMSREQLDDVTVELRQGRTRVTSNVGDLGPGDPATISFEQDLGVQDWDATVSGTWRDQPFDVTFEFSFEVTEGLFIEVPTDQIDLEARELTVVLSRPADRVEYEILRDDGDVMGIGSQSFEGAGAGEPLRLSYATSLPGQILKITLTGYDVDGFWAVMELIPWSVDIPHEEVHFASGSAEIEESELHKVDDAYDQLVDAV
ncbi:MAG: hypothetical protein KC561_19705, partial [Myxococcales bacterium]|nr:hypothetical protein [Myxococcales bacterium]